MSGTCIGFFHWEPYSVPYIVLPDGKAEVDLHVDQYVPYLLDDGDTAIHKSRVFMPSAAFQSEIFDLDDEAMSVCSKPPILKIKWHRRAYGVRVPSISSTFSEWLCPAF